MRKTTTLCLWLMLAGGLVYNQANASDLWTSFRKATRQQASPARHLKQALKQRSDELNLSWNGTTWDTSTRVSFMYYGNGEISRRTYANYYRGTYTTTSRTLYTYDGNNNITSELNQAFNSGKWDTTNRTLTTYDSHNNLIKELYQSYDGQKWTTNFGVIDSTTYNAKGMMIRQVSLGLDSTGNWAYEQKMEAVLDANGDYQYINIYSYQGGAWTQMARIANVKFLNNNFDLPLQYTVQLGFGGNWVNYQRGTYTYDAANRPLTVLTESYQVIKWVNDSRETYTYDANGSQTSYVTENWDASTSQWTTTTGTKNAYTMDADGNLLTNTQQDWNATGDSTYANTSKIIYEYGTIASVVNMQNTGISFRLYPNPVQGLLHVEATNVSADKSAISLMDMTGRIVYSTLVRALDGAVKTDIDISGFPSGQYILQFNNGSQLISSSLIKN